MPETTVDMDSAITALRSTAELLDAEEARLANELAAVKTKRKAVASSLTALTGPAPRRRGRPRKATAASA